MKTIKTKESTESNDGGERSVESAAENRASLKKKRGCLRVFVAFFLLAGLGASAVAYYYWARLKRPVDVESASSSDLVGWLALRDLSAESAETREQLFDRYFAALSVPSERSDVGADNEPEIELELELDGDDLDEPAPSAKFELPPAMQRWAGRFMAEREQKTTEAEPPRYHRPYWRVDYTIVPQTPRTSEFVVSDDVRPGPALIERWERRRDAMKESAAKEKGQVNLALERNVKLLIMQWFVAKYNEYDATPDAKKRAKLERCAEELNALQSFYDGLRQSSEIAKSTRVEALREFEATVDSWNDVASVEEVAKALWFKDLMVAVLAARESPFRGVSDGAFPPRVAVASTSAQDENETTGLAKPNAPKKTAAFRVGIDAVRGFVFQD